MSGSPELQKEINTWAIATAGIGALLLVGVTIEYGCLGKAGEELTFRVRCVTFSSIVRQDMSFFDKPENTVGQLTTQLSSDSNTIQGTLRFPISEKFSGFCE